MQDSEESSDTAVVRAWLQANMPGLDIASAAPVDITQIAVLEGAGFSLGVTVQQSNDKRVRCVVPMLAIRTPEAVQVHSRTRISLNTRKCTNIYRYLS